MSILKMQKILMIAEFSINFIIKFNQISFV